MWYNYFFSLTENILCYGLNLLMPSPYSFIKTSYEAIAFLIQVQ